MNLLNFPEKKSLIPVFRFSRKSKNSGKLPTLPSNGGRRRVGGESEVVEDTGVGVVSSRWFPNEVPDHENKINDRTFLKRCFKKYYRYFLRRLC